MLTFDNMSKEGGPDSLADRLQWILAHRGFETPTDLSQRAGLASNYVGVLMKGGRGKRGLRPETAKKIAAVAGVRAEWLALGTGLPTDDEDAATSAAAATTSPTSPSADYPNREQALAMLKHVKLHPGVLPGLKWERPPRDLGVQEWIERAHELDRMMLEADQKAAERRQKKAD